jgi:hypothetical protein
VPIYTSNFYINKRRLEYLPLFELYTSRVEFPFDPYLVLIEIGLQLLFHPQLKVIFLSSSTLVLELFRVLGNGYFGFLERRGQSFHGMLVATYEVHFKTRLIEERLHYRCNGRM